jgi:NADH:ubiquinone oxidoreductase subunit 2 (subunit N)
MPEVLAHDFSYLLPELVLTAGRCCCCLDVCCRARRRPVAVLVTGSLAAAALALGATASMQPWPAAGRGRRLCAFLQGSFPSRGGADRGDVVAVPDGRGSRPGEYYFLILVATLGMMFMAGGIDLITLVHRPRDDAVPFYILAGYHPPNRRSNEAAVKYFVLGTFRSRFSCTACRCCTADRDDHVRPMRRRLAGDGGLLLPFAVMLLVAGIGFKIAAVPFHMWAPDVYEGAPTPITAFLSVGSKAASFAMLLRIFVEGLPAFRIDGVGVAWGQPFGWSAFFYVLAVCR